VPEDVEVKDLADAKLIGRDDLLRVDAPAKILGRTVFTIDVDLPGMLTAVVLHPSKFGATVANVDDAAALAEPGVVAVVPVTGGVAVVGNTMQDALRGYRRLNVEWNDEAAERRSSEELLAEHRRLVESGDAAAVSRDDGNVEDALQEAEHVVDALYELPYVAHAPMEPHNAVCRMRENGVLDVWSSSESPEYTRMNAAEAAGVEKEQIEVHIPLAGGSFGLHTSVRNDPTSEASRSRGRWSSSTRSRSSRCARRSSRWGDFARWPCTGFEPVPTLPGAPPRSITGWPRSQPRRTCRSCAT